MISQERKEIEEALRILELRDHHDREALRYDEQFKKLLAKIAGRSYQPSHSGASPLQLPDQKPQKKKPGPKKKTALEPSNDKSTPLSSTHLPTSLTGENSLSTASGTLATSHPSPTQPKHGKQQRYSPEDRTRNIREVLLPYGETGLKVVNIAKATNDSENLVSVWFLKTGQYVPGFKRVRQGYYAYIPPTVPETPPANPLPQPAVDVPQIEHPPLAQEPAAIPSES